MRGGLSAGEAVMLSRLAREGRSIVGLDDLRRAGGVSYGHAKVAAARLRGKRWLLPLARGRYLISRLADGPEPDTTEHEFIVASALAGRRGCYIAYWNALNFHGYTEQVPLPVTAATTSRIPAATVHGVRYEFVTLSRAKFFGAEEGEVVGQKFMVSNKAKTVMDALDHPEYCGGVAEVAKCVWNARDDVPLGDVVRYAERARNLSIVKRLGYIVDRLGIGVEPDVYARMRELVSSGYSPMSTRSSRKGRRDSRWNLEVNVLDEEILDAKSET